MQGAVLQAAAAKRGPGLDPRTKLLLLIVMSTLVLGGMIGQRLWFLLPCFCAAPFLLLLTAGKYRASILYAVIYTGAMLLDFYAAPHLTGLLGFMLQGCVGMTTRFMPTVMLALYVMSMTTVSEFTAAMQKLQLSEKIIIPLSVMFRFFPTVVDEFSSINAAMKMRGIAIGGKNVGKMLEYRVIPLMICSVKIGEELSAAALTRGLGGTVKRTNVCKIGFHVQDAIVFLFCLGSAAAVLLDRVGLL